MAEGIVVKIWNVTVNKGERSGASQLASSIQYIENPERITRLHVNGLIKEEIILYVKVPVKN